MRLTIPTYIDLRCAVGALRPDSCRVAPTAGRRFTSAAMRAPFPIGRGVAVASLVLLSMAPRASAQCGSELQRFDYSGSLATYTAPATGNYWIEAAGAQGGNNTNSTIAPGLGALIGGKFALTSGAQLTILVGQQPSATSGNGGGGGSFVVDSLNSPLVVAGGGGGSSQGTDSAQKHGQAGTAGGAGAAGGGAGGTGGNGGSIGASGFQSGAGGGLLTNGADGWTSNTGGIAFVNGGAGGSTNAPANGGYGGGGSGSSYVVGGGGGGYSGGGSGGNSVAGVGGGGGSFNAGADQSNQGGVNSGSGYVRICSILGPSANVSITKTLTTAGPFVQGQTISYDLLVENGGPDTATSVQVTDTPANLTVTNVSGGGCSALPCTLASLASGADVTITVTATIDSAGAFDNSASVSAVESDTAQLNNTDDTGNGGSAAPSYLVPAASGWGLALLGVMLALAGGWAARPRT